MSLEKQDNYPPKYDNPRLEPTYKLRREWIVSQVLGSVIEDCKQNEDFGIADHIAIAVSYADKLIQSIDLGLKHEEIK